MKPKKKEFNLSEKIVRDLDSTNFEYLDVDWVKDFIKRLKEECDKELKLYSKGKVGIIIDKLAGEKLK
jgi:hypothetical protein|tara:strand:+ start:837 stop:1040 length:204 start_codon:yes stop_codon:yes gene_type:complete